MSDQPTTPTARFVDGASSRRRDVELRLRPEGVEIIEQRVSRAIWRWDDLRRIDAPPVPLRLANAGGPDLARLDVFDPVSVTAIRARARSLDAGQGRGGALKVVFWSLAAAGSLVGAAVLGMPLIADYLAPNTPPAIEAKIGEAVDNQFRKIFSAKTCEAGPGAQALRKLVGQISARVPTRFLVVPAVLDTPVPNAVALPGGKIYVFRGLIDKAKTPDEVAGVIAHEVGHIAHHDGMRRLIQNGGTSYLIGLLFGDVTGSSVVIALSRELAGASYSREAETRADATAIAAMRGLGRSPVGLGELLARLSPDEKDEKSGVGGLLRSHPLSAERLEAVRKGDGPVTGAPLLTDDEWAALRAVCAPAPRPVPTQRVEPGALERPSAARPTRPSRTARDPMNEQNPGSGDGP